MCPITSETNIYSMSLENEDIPSLSADTAVILAQFLKDKEEQDRKQPNEDWQLSQFWYNESTSDALTEQCLACTPRGGTIACVSCPSVFLNLCRRLAQGDTNTTLNVILLEFDVRFDKVYNVGPGSSYEFVAYDYKEPLEIPEGLVGKCDTVIADPPFLAVECLTKTAVTVRRLSKESTKLIVCTGEIMEEHVSKLMHCRKIEFKPEHENNLANAFSCFTNFDATKLD